VGHGVFLEESFGRRTMVYSVIFATGSLCCGFQLHPRWRGIFALTAGATMILARQRMSNERYELAFSVVGAAFFTAAHLNEPAFLS
jgi:hypothetical protein